MKAVLKDRVSWYAEEVEMVSRRLVNRQSLLRKLHGATAETTEVVCCYFWGVLVNRGDGVRPKERIKDIGRTYVHRGSFWTSSGIQIFPFRW